MHQLQTQLPALVNTGTDIPDAETLLQELGKLTAVKLFFVEDDAIQRVDKVIPADLVPVKSTMSIHQLFSDSSDSVHFRTASCFCEYPQMCNCCAPSTATFPCLCASASMTLSAV